MRKMLGAGWGCVAALATGGALAQQPPAVDGSGDEAIATVLVTATRRIDCRARRSDSRSRRTAGPLRPVSAASG